MTSDNEWFFIIVSYCNDEYSPEILLWVHYQFKTGKKEINIPIQEQEVFKVTHQREEV